MNALGLKELSRWAVTGLVAMGAAVGVQWHLASLPSAEVASDMLFVPAKSVTLGSASGFENMIADGLWLDLLQYYGGKLGLSTHFENLDPMFDLITSLDPHFWFAYWLGSWALGDDHQGAEAQKLLEKGEQFNPKDYNYPFQMGFIDFLDLRDYARASKDFLRASTLPDAPRTSRALAARMLQRQGLDAAAYAIWQHLYKDASDSVTRDIARRNVARIAREMAQGGKRAFPVVHSSNH